jgi:hypothetical protein
VEAQRERLASRECGCASSGPVDHPSDRRLRFQVSECLPD